MPGTPAAADAGQVVHLNSVSELSTRWEESDHVYVQENSGIPYGTLQQIQRRLAVDGHEWTVVVAPDTGPGSLANLTGRVSDALLSGPFARQLDPISGKPEGSLYLVTTRAGRPADDAILNDVDPRWDSRTHDYAWRAGPISSRAPHDPLLDRDLAANLELAREMIDGSVEEGLSRKANGLRSMLDEMDREIAQLEVEASHFARLNPMATDGVTDISITSLKALSMDARNALEDTRINRADHLVIQLLEQVHGFRHALDLSLNAPSEVARFRAVLAKQAQSPSAAASRYTRAQASALLSDVLAQAQTGSPQAGEDLLEAGRLIQLSEAQNRAASAAAAAERADDSPRGFWPAMALITALGGVGLGLGLGAEAQRRHLIGW